MALTPGIRLTSAKKDHPYRYIMDATLALKISTFIGTGYAANVVFMPQKYLEDQVSPLLIFDRKLKSFQRLFLT